MFHLGFYLYPSSNLSRESCANKDIVLGFVDNLFRFFYIERKIIQEDFYISSYGCNNLSIPVFFEFEGDNIVDIRFISKMPFIKNNVYISDSDFIIFNSESYIKKNLINGEELDIPGILLVDNSYSDKEIRFMQLIITKLQLEKASERLRLARTIFPDHYYNDFYMKAFGSKSFKNHMSKTICEYKKIINSTDIKKLVQSLSVRVKTYRTIESIMQKNAENKLEIYREAKLLDGTVIEDEYLKALIGLGEICISKENEYGFFKTNRVENGNYEGKILEKEKKRIIRKYSKEDHMAWLFYEQLKKENNNKLDLEKVEKYLLRNKESLNFEYSFDEIEKGVSMIYNLFGTKNDDKNEHLFYLNKYIENKLKLPLLKVIVSGYIENGKESLYRELVKNELFALANNYSVEIILGTVKEIDNMMRRILENNIFDINHERELFFIRNKNPYDYKKVKMLVGNTNLILLIGDERHCLFQNYKTIAEELNIPVKILKLSS